MLLAFLVQAMVSFEGFTRAALLVGGTLLQLLDQSTVGFLAVLPLGMLLGSWSALLSVCHR